MIQFKKLRDALTANRAKREAASIYRTPTVASARPAGKTAASVAADQAVRALIATHGSAVLEHLATAVRRYSPHSAEEAVHAATQPAGAHRRVPIAPVPDPVPKPASK